jgi:ACR3 family arsenite efflux pump ArsB
VVIGSQITAVVRDIGLLMPVIPVYVGFLLLAPLMGALASKLFALPAMTARAVTFSASTRNSLVVLPLALALPEDVRGIAATAVILQTLVELVGELIYIRLVPLWVWPANR